MFCQYIDQSNMLIVRTKYFVKSGDKMHTFEFHHATKLLVLHHNQQPLCFWEISNSNIDEKVLENALKDAIIKVPLAFK